MVRNPLTKKVNCSAIYTKLKENVHTQLYMYIYKCMHKKGGGNVYNAPVTVEMFVFINLLFVPLVDQPRGLCHHL